MKFSTARKRIIKIIDELESQCTDYYEQGRASAGRQQEWIPCSERVPIEYRTVLVTWEYAGKSYTTTAFRKTKNAVTYWASNEQPKYTPLKVVAWMPLPEPWEGADDERMARNDHRM